MVCERIDASLLLSLDLTNNSKNFYYIVAGVSSFPSCDPRCKFSHIQTSSPQQRHPHQDQLPGRGWGLSRARWTAASRFSGAIQFALSASSAASLLWR